MMKKLIIVNQNHVRTSTLYRIKIKNAKMSLIQTIEKTMTQTRKIRALIMKNNDDFNQKIAIINVFKKKTNELKKFFRLFNDASKNYIAIYFFFVDEKIFNIQQLLSHFKNKIKKIVHNVFANTTHVFFFVFFFSPYYVLYKKNK